MTNGKGTVHFKPGQWSVKFNADGTYEMKPPLSKPDEKHTK